MSRSPLNEHKDQAALAGDHTLRVAVAGAGAMARAHIRAIQALDADVRIVGIADPSSSARALARERVPEVTEAPSLVELLDLVEADVVHVCTPMETHAVVARDALDAGCHVYVEKPVTPGAAELDPLLTHAARKGLKVCAGHQVLFERPYRRLLKLLPAVGKIVHVESYFSFRAVRTTSGTTRPLTQAEQLVDVLPHPSYLLLDALEHAVPDGASELEDLHVTLDGTVHGHLRRGELTGSLMVSLEARPVEHWLRVVGTNGLLHADFVRGSVQDLLGPGTSGIDKALNPFRLSSQLAFRTTASLGRRISRRGGSYPGLEEIFSAFYNSIGSGGPSPTSDDQIRGTVRICDEVRREFERLESAHSPSVSESPQPPSVLVTGGTGLLGREVVETLRRANTGVRVVARRRPAAHHRVPGVEYVTANLAEGVSPQTLSGIRRVVHCAAETSGGWDAHQRNSIDATERLLRTAAEAGVETFVHVSSVAVLDSSSRGPVQDDAPLHPEPETLGPYGWGKLESERIVRTLGPELGIDVKVLRPVPLVEWDRYAPPGRLGRRIGNVYVAVGNGKDRLVVAGADESARAVAAAVLLPDEVPDTMNLVPREPPTRRDLVARLRDASPEVRVLWLPRFVLKPLSWTAVGLQKLIRPGRPAVQLAQAFASVEYEVGPAGEWMSRDSSLSTPEREVVGAS